MFVPDHPLQFEPLYRSYLWGGNRLASRLGKRPPGPGVWAESWEIVDHREGESTVNAGPLAGKSLRELIQAAPEPLLGPHNPEDRFPLLLKYLDCHRVLSVQVHPDDAYGAQMSQPDRGKTEAWYVVEAEPGAVLYAGLRPGVGRVDLERAIAAGAAEDCLHTLAPKPGDCVFIPAGTVHALGAGLIVAEIQQSSDCTFRLFDWNRVDDAGQPRPLHVAQALEVIDFDRGPVSIVSPQPSRYAGVATLVECDKFQLDEWRGPCAHPLPASTYSIVTVPHGHASLLCGEASYPLATGQSALIPKACAPRTRLSLPEGAVALVATPPRSHAPGEA